MLKDLEESIEFSESEFETKYLSKFDTILDKFDTESSEGYANDAYKAIVALIKQAEKEYDFNIIDPVDEERDHIELKHKLLSYEKAKHESNPILIEKIDDDVLTDTDRLLFDKIEEIKDLNELKQAEDRIVKLLRARDPD